MFDAPGNDVRRSGVAHKMLVFLNRVHVKHTQDALFSATGDKSTVPILNRELSTLCGVVKKYLRELTNPLIPTEFYEDFISAASKLLYSEDIISSC